LGIKESVISGAIRVLEEKVKEMTEGFRTVVKERKLAKDCF
jgi:hypothetical protein